MNRSAIVDAVIGVRFNSNQIASVREWVDLAYGKAWDYADWPFKYDQTDITVTGGSVTPTVTATDVARYTVIYRDDGVKLKYITPQEYDSLYAEATDQSDPVHYTLVNRTIYFGPIPSTSATYTGRYTKRRPTMGDSDEPEFDSEYHYSLVFGATALGLKLENDPTWDVIEQEFVNLLAQMREHYFPPQIGENRAYGGSEEVW